MTANEQKEEKSPRVKEIVEAIGLIVSILVAGTVLLSNSANVPWWWFHFSFIVLVALTFFIPTVIFIKPSERVKKLRLKRKRNAVSRKHFSEFRDLVDVSRRFNSDIRNIFNDLRSSQDALESSFVTHILQSYNEPEVSGLFYYIDKDIKKSDKTFRELYLIMKQVESIVNIYKKNLKIIEEFVHEIRDFKGKKIAKGIEDDFDVFRDKYNYFMNDFKKFCHKVNQEIGENELPEHAFSHVKKW